MASKMIQAKVHIHYAKVPVIAVFYLQNPYSFVDVTYEKKKKIARERPTRERWRR